MTDRLLLAVGDVLVERDNPLTAFEPTLDLLAEADILFGNCEAVYATDVEPAPSASIPVLCGAHNASALGPAGFHVMSLANNHTVDGGHRGLLQTIERLTEQGVQVSGAGRNWDEAHRAAVVERDGWRVAFLSYSCEYPAGYGARETSPGIATLRTHTLYYPSEMSAFQSGGHPEQLTIANPNDLQLMQREIREARADADVVVVSVHAGDGSRPAVVTEYERQIARASIDAGADAYLGHHHHMLRGAEYYRGKPMFYGLGHFVFDVPDFESQVPPSVLSRMKQHAGEYGYGYRDDGYPLLPMHPDARMTVIAVLDFGEDGPRFGAIPATINPQGQPVVRHPASADGRRVAAYLRELNEVESLNGRWVEAADANPVAMLELRPGEEGS